MSLIPLRTGGWEVTVPPYIPTRSFLQYPHKLYMYFAQTFREGNHWLSRGATRRQMLATTIAFLNTNDPQNVLP
jgi:hypothetical protein